MISGNNDRSECLQHAMSLLLAAAVCTIAGTVIAAESDDGGATASLQMTKDESESGARNVATPDAVSKARNYFGEHVLTDQDGRKHRFYSDLLHGRVVLINVVFTKCPSACPMMTERLKLVRRQLGDDFGKSIHFLSISVDPVNDTPAAMKKFAQRHQADVPGWKFLVADAETLKALLSRLGQWSDTPGDHTTLLIGGNAAKAHWLKLRPDAPPERVSADLQRLK